MKCFKIALLSFLFLTGCASSVFTQDVAAGDQAMLSKDYRKAHDSYMKALLENPNDSSVKAKLSLADSEESNQQDKSKKFGEYQKFAKDLKNQMIIETLGVLKNPSEDVYKTAYFDTSDMINKAIDETLTLDDDLKPVNDVFVKFLETYQYNFITKSYEEKSGVKLVDNPSIYNTTVGEFEEVLQNYATNNHLSFDSSYFSGF